MKRQSLKNYTERAIEATEAGKLIPPIVYLPPKLRGHKHRLSVDDIRVTENPPDIKENVVRIEQADPLGFLLALMQGQPIPSFVIADDATVMVEYQVASLELRKRVAEYLADKQLAGRKSKGTTNANTTDEEFSALLKDRARD